MVGGLILKSILNLALLVFLRGIGFHKIFFRYPTYSTFQFNSFRPTVSTGSIEESFFSPTICFQISNECQYISDKLNISVDELESFHQLPLSYYYDYPNMSRLFGLGEYVLSKISNIRRGGAL